MLGENWVSHWGANRRDATRGIVVPGVEGDPILRGVRDVFERAALSGETPVLLTSPGIRPYVRSIIERFRGQTPVLRQNEVHPRARLKTVGTI